MGIGFRPAGPPSRTIRTAYDPTAIGDQSTIQGHLSDSWGPSASTPTPAPTRSPGESSYASIGTGGLFGWSGLSVATRTLTETRRVPSVASLGEGDASPSQREDSGRDVARGERSGLRLRAGLTLGTSTTGRGCAPARSARLEAAKAQLEDGRTPLKDTRPPTNN